MGFAVLQVQSQHRLILNFCVSAKHQRQGVGTALMQSIVRHSVDQQCFALRLEVPVVNTVAVGFYRQLGFSVVCRCKDFYLFGDRWVDAWCMHRRLNHDP